MQYGLNTNSRKKHSISKLGKTKVLAFKFCLTLIHNSLSKGQQYWVEGQVH